MKRILLSFALLIGIVCTGNCKSARKAIKSSKDSLSYAIGVNAGMTFRDNLAHFPGGEKAVDIDMLAEAFLAGLKNIAPQLTKEQSLAIMQAHLEKVEKENKKKQEEAYKASKKENNKYLDEQTNKHGYTEMLNAPCKDCHGTLIKKTIEKYGEFISDTDFVCLNYTAKLTNGKIFDQSENGVAVFPVDGVIEGLGDALQQMRKGEKASIIVPSELGYGKEEIDSNTIPANSILIFDIEVIDVFHTEKAVNDYLESIGGGQNIDE